MPSYKAPLRDMYFIIHELLNLQDLLQTLPHYQAVDSELIDPILSEAAKFTENELFPLNQIGDRQGCYFNQGEVQTPKGFKEAYQHFVSGGWMSLNAKTEYGGQGLPKVLQIALDEMLCSSNLSFSLYTVLTQGAVQALYVHGSEEMKQTYLPKLVSGEWSGTMCLTESHCGTDLGLLKAKAEPAADGSYQLYGTKIFITSGEHDLTENIIHTVLARLPDAPPGVKGISLFLVPKYLINADGSLNSRNAVYCGAIEHKMGIKGSATCVLNFEGATGYLIGEKHKGLQAMFSMMNIERLNIGLEGLGLAEIAYQNAVIYAKERLQGRGPNGTVYPDKPADPIIVHPDIRRMLLTIRAFTEGARALAFWTAQQIDIAHYHPDSHEREKADGLTALMTPVIKAFFSDYGFLSCNLALQVYGGHGYIAEWGIEQYVRDARIAQIYEGTNGVQALDLIKRKLIANQGEYLKILEELINHFVTQEQNNPILQAFILPLKSALTDLNEISKWILEAAKKNQAEIGAASVDYLHILGLVLLGFMWAQMAKLASENLAKSQQQEADFYQAKLHTARFFFQKMLPNIGSLKQIILGGSDVLMDMPVEMF